MQKKLGRQEQVLKAAMSWYDRHVADGLGQDELGRDLLVLFRRCKALKALDKAKERTRISGAIIRPL
jgi:hypothetical protein